MIVSDTSPLNYLILIDAIDLLPQMYNSVVVPTIVIDELTRIGAPARVQQWAINPPPWVRMASPIHVSEEIRGLDAGESAAIALALQLGDTTLLIDERSGTRKAQSLGLFTIGTLGVLLGAQEAQLADSQMLFESLVSQTNFRLSLRQRLEFFADLEALKQ